MSLIVALIWWKGFRQAQAPKIRAEGVYVGTRVIVDSKVSLRRLGERDAQEMGRPSYADPSEGCIIKMCFRRRIAFIAEAISNLECGLFSDNKRFDECSSSKERLDREQGMDKVKKPHVGGKSCLIDDGKAWGMRGRSFICADSDVGLPPGVELGASSFYIKMPQGFH